MWPCFNMFVGFRGEYRGPHSPGILPHWQVFGFSLVFTALTQRETKPFLVCCCLQEAASTRGSLYCSPTSVSVLSTGTEGARGATVMVILEQCYLLHV